MSDLPLRGPVRDEVQAHRGASAVAPENTIAAFRAAAAQGAKWVELDVALLADGTLVVIHDDTVDRTTSGKGSLGDLDFADLTDMDAGTWFSTQFADERLPTLEQVIAVLGELGLSANVEIKQHAHHKSLDQLVEAVRSAIATRRPETQIMISSFDPACLKAMAALEPDLEMAMLWVQPPQDWEAQLTAIPATTIHLYYKALSIGFLEMAREKNIKVRAWTSNDPAELYSFWNAGLTGVITDNPAIYLGVGSMLSSRQQDILALIEADGAQLIEHLATRYGITTQTARRDINALCELGYARRFHGGVDLPVKGRNISVNARSVLHRAAKQAIATRIATIIEPGSTVFMGIGSTVQCVAEALLHHQNLTVVTNNIDVALTLCDAPQIEVHMTGGLLRHNDRDVVGADVIRFFEKFYASYAVIGAGALHPTNGVLDFSYSEAQITSILIENSRTALLAADASKWTRDASVRVVPFSKIGCLVTDMLPDETDAQHQLGSAGTKIVLCEPV